VINEAAEDRNHEDAGEIGLRIDDPRVAASRPLRVEPLREPEAEPMGHQRDDHYIDDDDGKEGKQQPRAIDDKRICLAALARRYVRTCGKWLGMKVRKNAPVFRDAHDKPRLSIWPSYMTITHTKRGLSNNVTYYKPVRQRESLDCIGSRTVIWIVPWEAM